MISEAPWATEEVVMRSAAMASAPSLPASIETLERLLAGLREQLPVGADLAADEFLHLGEEVASDVAHAH